MDKMTWIDEMSEVNTVESDRFQAGKRMGYQAIKRIFDVVSSVVGLILLSPLFLVLVLMIKKEDRGTVFYKHRRVGKGEKDFDMYKFRTMKMGADDIEKTLTEEERTVYLKEFKLKDDPRITKVGEKLRTTSMDELPQLLNILKGEMSVVGPRPILREELLYYTEEEREKLLSIRPGLTGYWQAYMRNHASYESGKRQKMEMFYIAHQSVLLDLKILLRTVVAVLREDGVV